MATTEYELLAKLDRSAAAQSYNIPVVEDAEATGDVAEAYKYFRERFGRPDIPGILKCFSSSPALLRGMMETASSLLFSDGTLGRGRKEMIATSVSALNACPYCADSHGFFLRVHGGTEATVAALIGGDAKLAELDAADQALLAFVGKVNGESQRIGPKDIDELRNNGWRDEQIAEAVHIAGMFAFFNRVANAFGLVSQGLLDLEVPATSRV